VEGRCGQCEDEEEFHGRRTLAEVFCAEWGTWQLAFS
jgi:hypothetical protein